MGMVSRMSTIVKSKMNRILDKAEDPRETLDYAYEKQMEMLRNVKRGVVEILTNRLHFLFPVGEELFHASNLLGLNGTQVVFFCQIFG